MPFRHQGFDTMRRHRQTTTRVPTVHGPVVVRPRARHTMLRTGLLGVAVFGLLAACATGPGSTAGSDRSTGSSGVAQQAATPESTPEQTPTVALTPNVTPDSPVAIDTVVSVKATDGTISSVALTYKDTKSVEQTVQGSISPDADTWTAESLLEPNTKYSLAMTGLSADGTTHSSTSTFSTQNLSAKQQITARISQNGGTVGVAMPVVVRFDVPVKDKAAFERKMTVTSDPAQPGSWAWYGSSEAHWRPVTYWQPGTKVTVKVDVNSVPAGGGTYGKASVTGGFTVGGSLTMKADLKAHQLYVTIGGKLARTIPISGGKPGMESRSGTKVILEKSPQVIMDSETIGISKDNPDYYRLDVRWAMRETTSGEFLHAAPWSVGSQGVANVSHGCIGMSTANAEWLFAQVKIGDPVTVTGTGRSLERGNGWTDWNVSFDEFKKYSALNAAA